jgi:hypothetical protein
VSQVLSHYPQLQPGLCGSLECRRMCARACHCEAGLRRGRVLLAERARRRFAIKANRRQEEICARIRKASLCPRICQRVGGCFLPQAGDHPSEAKRKVFRCQYAVDLLVSLGFLCKESPPKKLYMEVSHD